MPISGARYRYKRFPSGQKIRLAFVNNKVVEIKKPDGEIITKYPKNWRSKYGMYRSS